MEQEILTKQEVEALLSCLEDENENINTTEEAKPMRNIDPEDVISQAEIDALLSGKPIEEPEINLPKDFQVRHEERLHRIQSAKDEVMSVMESLNIETQQLLQGIMSHDTNNEDWDGYEAQRVLGDCYAFLNECHAKLKKLDDLRLRENRLIKQLSTMVRSEDDVYTRSIDQS